jgi:cytochrome b pre-mRNA-processing protein 3
LLRAYATGIEQLGSQKGDLKQHILLQLTATRGEYDKHELPQWQKMVGERVVNTLKLDMEQIRSGPVAGRMFRDLCKGQAFYVENAPLTPTAKFWYETLGLPKTFQQWFSITCLHVWMLYVRMRMMPRKYGREYQQKLVNELFADIDYRLREVIKVHSDRTVNNYKKNFNEQLTGAVFAYDEALGLDDFTLAASLWRNIFESHKDVDVRALEQLVHYVRTQLYVLDRMSDQDFSQGRFTFIEPWLRYEPLTPAQEKELSRAIEQVHGVHVDKTN